LGLVAEAAAVAAAAGAAGGRRPAAGDAPARGRSIGATIIIIIYFMLI
jgi:hypothetical protein